MSSNERIEKYGATIADTRIDQQEQTLIGASHQYHAEAHMLNGELRRPIEQKEHPGYRRIDRNPGTGSSGIGGIETVVLKGNPDQAGVYTIMLRVPAHTRIAAHSHRDDRVATVISGTWHIGYGDRFDEAKLKAVPPGSFYSEPPSGNHFAETSNTLSSNPPNLLRPSIKRARVIAQLPRFHVIF